ncbi:hypothetical protein J6590_073804 [Homalodisca vitripennis]|nr:hypothetical protein J6590_073804 [Homalodisca vitripennis]
MADIGTVDRQHVISKDLLTEPLSFSALLIPRHNFLCLGMVDSRPLGWTPLTSPGPSNMLWLHMSSFWRSLEDDDRATSNNNDLLDDESIVNILGATTEIGRDIVEKRPTEQWLGLECNPDETSAAAVLNYAYLQPAFLSRV